MVRLLKFRYIFLMMAILGCRDSSKKSAPEGAETGLPAEETPAVTQNTKTILFFGDSLTAGLGLDPNQAFPALIQKRLDSLGYSYQVVNAGLSGETTASGRNRLDWVLRQPVGVFVLELGANDGLRGIPLSETRKNLEEMIVKVREKYPGARIVLAGMQLPPNMGPEYTGEFQDLFPELAQKHQVMLIPFLLKGVGGVPEMNQADGIHPTAEGHAVVAENVWEVLGPVLVEYAGSRP
ncbi:arylesterase [Robiginitalea marina]|uniref:Arylesterase n=1 Tax=Robiginitalea marina TaxID=2954105 RepID=A0ABT1AXB5_9FLAO|nr:arylesterase [Robiginitalea marina]MCO5723998.1 arylesterase [Robiginitalea marina]